MSVAKRAACAVARPVAYPVTGERRGAGWHPGELFDPMHPQGFWLAGADNSAMWQDALGTTPVTADGQSVGLVLDKRLWGGKTLAQVLAEQPELNANTGNPYTVTSGYEPRATSGGGSGTFEILDGRLRLTADDTFGWKHIEFALPTTAGKAYRVRFRGISTGVSNTGARNWTGVAESPSISMSSVGTHEVTIVATGSSALLRFYIRAAGSSGVGEYVELEFLEISEIPGNHVEQSSSSLRPTYQATHLRGDGTDDRLITAQRPTLAGTLIYAGTFEAVSDVAIGATGAGGIDRCMLRTSTDGYLQASIGDQAAIVGATDIRGVDGVYAVRWGGDGEAVKLTRNLSVEYEGVQAGSVTTEYPFLVGAVNVAGAASNFLDGKMRHCLFVPRFISDSELAQAVSYFS